MRKNQHGRILIEELKEQYLSTVPKSCSYLISSIKIILIKNSIKIIIIYFHQIFYYYLV